MACFSTGGETHGSPGRGTESGSIHGGHVPGGTSTFWREDVDPGRRMVVVARW